MNETRFGGFLKKGMLPDPKTADLTGLDGEFAREYVDSTTSLLADLEAASLKLESKPDNEDHRAGIRRIVHSIKGESGIVGVIDVYELCHAAESAFEEIHDPSEAVDMVLRVKDWIQSVIQRIDAAIVGNDAPSGSGKLRALIVDDSSIARKRVCTLISDSFDCDFACNGREAVEAYGRSVKEERRYDLVTLDINMPEMNGHETIVAIRNIEKRHGLLGLDGVKIIMTTTESGAGHVFPAFKEGCEAYVIKRKLADELLDEIAGLGLIKECSQTGSKSR